RVLAEQPNAQPTRSDIDNEDSDDDGQEYRANVGIVEFPDRDYEFLPDTAGSDKAHDRGLANVDLKAQQDIARITCNNLLHNRKTHAGGPTRTRGAHAFDRLHVGVLNHLGKQLSQGAGGMDRNREHACHWPEAESDDKDQREDDRWNGTGKLQQPANDEA